MKLRDEFLEFIQIQFSKIKLTITFSIPVILAILSLASGKSDYIWVTVYLFVIYFLGVNSLHILFAKEELPAIEVAGSAKKPANRSIPKYRLLIPFAWGGLILAVLLILVFMFIPPANTPVNNVIYGTPTLTPTITVTPTQTNTATVTITLTPTSTQTFTPTPKAQGVYYMIVLDASDAMTEAFDGRSKWDLAQEAVAAILQGFEPGANYGLIVVGGGPTIPGVDVCNEPSALKAPFSPRSVVSDQVSQLEPAGGGSLFAAFALAKNQFEGLDERTVRTLIYITGSSDACDRDEWRDLQRYFELQGDSGVKLYSEIIVLDPDGELTTQNIPQRLNALSENIHVQAPQNIVILQQSYATVVNNINTYIENTIASFPTSTPIPSATPILPTLTSRPVSPTAIPSITITPSITSTIGAPTTALTWTPSVTPVTPSATAIQQTSVQLLSVSYVSQGVGCQVDVQVQVAGSPAVGTFHVRNAFYAPGESSVYPQTTLQTGTNYASTFSLSNLITLGGDQPAYYEHEIWFEYNGTQSNHLAGLVCPGIPPP